MVVMGDVPARTRWKRSRNRLKKMIRLGNDRARAKASFNNGREPWGKTPQAERHGRWRERRGDVRPPACSMPLSQRFFRKAWAAESS
jgi:hypothetical protein